MKKRIREIVGFILFQLRIFSRPSQKKILSIYFHNPPKKLFERIIRWLHENGYEFISTEELSYLIKNKIIPEKKSVIVTFDDGWNGNLNLLDTIKKYQLPVTFFIATAAVTEGNFWWEYAGIKGQQKVSGLARVGEFKKLPYREFAEKIDLLKNTYLLKRSCITTAELKNLSDQRFITIGSHTVTHPILINCPLDILQYELSESRKWLEAAINKEVKYFSYPNGDFDQSTIKNARDAGYEICFTTQTSKIDISNANECMIPRYAINDHGGYYENLAKIFGVWQLFSKQNKA